QSRALPDGLLLPEQALRASTSTLIGPDDNAEPSSGIASSSALLKPLPPPTLPSCPVPTCVLLFVTTVLRSSFSPTSSLVARPPRTFRKPADPLTSSVACGAVLPDAVPVPLCVPVPVAGTVQVTPEQLPFGVILNVVELVASKTLPLASVAVAV